MKMFIKNGKICEGETGLMVQVVELFSQGFQAKSIQLGLTRNLVQKGCLMVCCYIMKPTGPINKKDGRHKQNGQ